MICLCSVEIDRPAAAFSACETILRLIIRYLYFEVCGNGSVIATKLAASYQLRKGVQRISQFHYLIGRDINCVER